MKKIYQIIILLVSLLYIYTSTDYCDIDDGNVSKKSTCHDRTIESSGDYCCYLKYKYNGETYSICSLLDKEEKENIKDTINDYKSQGTDVKSLDCKSSFIELGLFSLAFLLL